MDTLNNETEPTVFDTGVSDEVIFCRKCVMPNTRPTPCNEYDHKPGRQHSFMTFDKEGVCSACRFSEQKWGCDIDWDARENELWSLCDQYRSKDGSYDCIVPGSGGKDSAFAAHILKYKYRMNPLTVTWAPHLYTDIGWRNFQNWLHIGGFDNYLFTPNGKVHRLLTRNAFINLLHPFQSFVLGQKSFAVKMAAKFDINLVFYGENPGQYGSNTSIGVKKFSSGKNSEGGHRLSFDLENKDISEIFLGGTPIEQYLQEGISYKELEPYLPIAESDIAKRGIDVYYLGYFIRWVPQEAYYYAVQHCGFTPNESRSEGTYSKYSSLDDKTDGFFYYTAYIKFGFGRTTQDASQEIRNNHITRDEGIALVKRYDGEFPKLYFNEFLDYISMSENEFHTICDKYRSPKLWHKQNGVWKLRFTC